MNKVELVNTINNTINGLEASKWDYLQENSKSLDSHIMWLTGQIDGMKFVIQMIEKEFASE
jgi:hypothetical protein